ncbi:MAG: hypothetical protein Q9226_004168 [Calogaya cf. arnoldii]
MVELTQQKDKATKAATRHFLLERMLPTCSSTSSPKKNSTMTELNTQYVLTAAFRRDCALDDADSMSTTKSSAAISSEEQDTMTEASPQYGLTTAFQRHCTIGNAEPMLSTTPPASTPPSYAPPPYSESLNLSRAKDYINPQAKNYITRHISDLVSTHIIPNLDDFATNATATTTLVLVPSATTGFSGTTKLDDEPFYSYPGELLVGFHEQDNPKLIRFEDGQGIWLGLRPKPSLIRETFDRIGRELSLLGYQVTHGVPCQSLDRPWQYFPEGALASGQARILVEVKRVCLRIENSMGLYETRSAAAIVVKVELCCD